MGHFWNPENKNNFTKKKKKAGTMNLSTKFTN